jgi:hypothetical protein
MGCAVHKLNCLRNKALQMLPSVWVNSLVVTCIKKERDRNDMTVICRELLLLNRLQEGSSASPPQTFFMMGMLAGRLFHRQMQIDEAGQVILITTFRLSRSIWEIKRE